MSRTVAASVATATPRRGSSASVLTRACTPAAVSRRRPSSSAPTVASSAGPGPAGPALAPGPSHSAAAPPRPNTATRALGSRPTRDSELVGPQVGRRLPVDVEDDRVAIRLDDDVLGHGLARAVAPGAHPVAAGLQA